MIQQKLGVQKYNLFSLRDFREAQKTYKKYIKKIFINIYKNK